MNQVSIFEIKRVAVAATIYNKIVRPYIQMSEETALCMVEALLYVASLQDEEIDSFSETIVGNPLSYDKDPHYLAVSSQVDEDLAQRLANLLRVASHNHAVLCKVTDQSDEYKIGVLLFSQTFMFFLANDGLGDNGNPFVSLASFLRQVRDICHQRVVDILGSAIVCSTELATARSADPHGRTGSTATLHGLHTQDNESKLLASIEFDEEVALEPLPSDLDPLYNRIGGAPQWKTFMGSQIPQSQTTMDRQQQPAKRKRESNEDDNEAQNQSEASVCSNDEDEPKCKREKKE